MSLTWTGDGKHLRWGPGLVLGLACLAAASVSAQPAAEDPIDSAPVLDRVVAVVEGRPITLSELEFETRVALVQRGGQEAARAQLDAQTLESGLDLAINQRLQANEADKLQAFQLEPEVLASAHKAFRDRLGTEEALKAFLERNDADESLLLAVLERGLRAERVLDSRVRLKAQVTESEVRRYYEENQARLGGAWEALRGAIREKLTRERYASVAAEELSTLRRLSRVRQVVSIQEVVP